MLSALGSVLGPGSALYVSSPITSGRRFLEATDSKASRSALVAQNLRSSGQVVERLRSENPGSIIYAAGMEDIPGWEQDDYRSFWGAVIERFAVRAVFLDDWEFSNGCSYEFLVCSRNGIPCEDQEHGELSIEAGARSIAEAASLLRCKGADAGFLECVLGELSKLKVAS
jgi:hypothetical protein